MATERLKERAGVNNNVSVTPVLVLCDNSGTMSDYVQITRQCLQNMVDGLKKRPVHRSGIDLCIATFNTDFKVLLPFTRLANVQAIPPIEPSDLATYLGTAVSKSVDLLAKEKESLKKAAISYCQPALIILSDGLPEYEKEHVTKAGIKAIQDKIQKERWSCIPILIGEEFADQNTIMAELASKDKNGVRQEFKFSSDDQISNLVASLEFASASISAIAENQEPGISDFYQRFRRLSEMAKNHRILSEDGN